LGSATLLACGTTVPAFLARSALATPRDDRSNGHVLVVVELNGGNDGLNTVVPYGDELYRKHRPKLQIAAGSLHKVDGHIGLHPALGELSGLFKQGKLAIVQSVGYPNANRSHFESMAIWQTAVLKPNSQTAGWLNRGASRRTAASGGDGTAMHIGDGELPRALVGDALDVPSLTSLDQVVRRVGVPDRAGATAQRALLDRIARLPRGASGSHLEFIQRSQVVTYTSSARIEEILRRGQSERVNNYPDFLLAQRLKLVAQLIKVGLSTSIYYVQLDGFDTHQNQLEVHGSLLREFGDSVSAFLEDLKRTGEEKRVILLAFSEFGRRLTENSSRGTDHGTAAPVFLAGTGVRSGLYGPYPNLSDLQDGDPRHAIDFREVYATLLDRWLDCPSRFVLGQEFAHLPVVAI
jgi:uncharacterized protein (DUF1501 family)